jgi:hypothetical protein
MRERAAQAALGRRDDPRVHAEQPFDQPLAAGLLSDLPDHRVERILPVLDLAARKSPVAPGDRRYTAGEEHPLVLDAHGVCRQPEAHPVLDLTHFG